MSDTRILLLGDPSGDLVRALTKPGIVVTQASDAADALRLAGAQEVVILDVAEGFRATAECCRSIRSEPALIAIPVLCVSTTDDVEERILLLEAGADDVIARPFDDRELEARLEALRLRFERSRDLAPAPTAPATSGKSGRRLIAVHSPKGGVGTTTIAVNLAVSLASRVPDVVALLDFATPLGQVATHLNITPRQTLSDLGRDAVMLHQPDFLRAVAERHASGLNVFAASGAPAPGPALPVHQAATVLEAAVLAYPTVIVDAGSALDDVTLTILARADDVILVLTPDFPTVKAVHGLLEYLDTIGSGVSNPTIVLNEMWAREILRLADIQEALGTEVSVRLPYDALLYLKAVNEGIPLVVSAPRSGPAQRFADLAKVILGESEPHALIAAPKSRGLGGIFKRG